ncbi:SDR family NAD(P)-dependent oxidoreductase [Sorangium sp. So ce128]|uniref:SDR family NAD(P)-dependent oxidoreductase n=1 Tax=Sorangium sp. So ce128 TaxID=3133281 RepID=UPI003F62AD2B
MQTISLQTIIHLVFGVSQRALRQAHFRGSHAARVPSISPKPRRRRVDILRPEVAGLVIGLTKAAAIDFAARNVRVNAICPGGTHTAMFDRWIKDGAVEQHVLASHPIGRFADPIEPARVALFLASDEASFVTGVALPIDGGLVAA